MLFVLEIYKYNIVMFLIKMYSIFFFFKWKKLVKKVIKIVLVGYMFDVNNNILVRGYVGDFNF